MSNQPNRSIRRLMIGAVVWGLLSVGLFGAHHVPAGELTVDDSGIAPDAKITAVPKFGVHEVELSGDGGVANPFDTIATVTFTPHSGAKQSKNVYAFHDGGNTWRARVYASETGAWIWTSHCGSDRGLNGKSGEFTVDESNLSGRLLPHVKNPRHWMTENGKWFLNLSDTAYFLLSPYTAIGEPVREADVKAYVRDAVDRGVTSVRCFAPIGPQGYLEDGKNFARRWRDSVFDDEAYTRLRLDHLRVADDRLRWLLADYPDLYVQFILFPRGSRHGQDDHMWQAFTPAQKERVMRYMIARYAAYPQLFWLVANDAHYGPKFPKNNAYAREVGAYFRKHDPWRHPLATGHARKIEYYFSGEDWSSYIHLEDNFDVGAAQYTKYQQFGKPVFLGEDRYEQDHPEDRDPLDMRYFQRRLFWSWLFSGGSTNYGGRWWVVHPYAQTGSRPAASPWSAIAGGEVGATQGGVLHIRQLVGLDSVKVIANFFGARAIELSDFVPDHALVRDPGVTDTARSPKLMRRGHDEFLVYHPNATADDRTARADPSKTPSLVVDLHAVGGKFTVEWMRAVDGVALSAEPIEGGQSRTLASPWSGQDCVVRLRRE